MSDATLWWMLVAVAVGTELLTGTFYLLMLALGLVAGALAAHVGAGVSTQLIAVALVGGGAVAALYHWRPNPPRHVPPQADANVNLDIGQTLHIAHWGQGSRTHASYRGAQWSVEYLPCAEAPHPSPGLHRIREVVGACLHVERV